MQLELPCRMSALAIFGAKRDLLDWRLAAQSWIDSRTLAGFSKSWSSFVVSPVKSLCCRTKRQFDRDSRINL